MSVNANQDIKVNQIFFISDILISVLQQLLVTLMQPV